MTNRILQSDIDIAKRLMEARNTDEEIVGILTRRGIERVKADQLVAALRSGARVEPEVEINYEVGKFSPELADTTEAVAEAPQSNRARGGSGTRRSGKKWIIWLLILLVIGAAVAFLVFSEGKVQPNETQPGEANLAGEAPAAEQTLPGPGEVPAPAPPPADVPVTAPATNQ